MGETKIVPLREARRAQRKQKQDDPPEGGDVADGPGPCPITALGHRDGAYWFFDVAGQLRMLTAQQLGQSPQLVSLFGRSIGWAKQAYPQFDRDGNRTEWFSVRNCGAALVQMCHDSGLFNSREPVRGLGVWRADGQIVAHLGDRVLATATGDMQPAGFRAHGSLWPAHPRIEPPGPPASVAMAEQVETLFRRWNWSRRSSLSDEVRIFTGLWAAGLLGAAIAWRPHALVVGPPGSGKSSLLELYAALSPLAEMSNDYTEAGLRQMITGRAAPLILDEADEDPDSMGRLQKVIGLLRRASGGSGAQVTRGSGDGKAQRFEVMSPAVLGAVLPPPLGPADATRITRMDLLPRPRAGARELPGDAGIAWARAHAASLWGRALAGLPRFAANLLLLRAELLDRGCAPRLADQLGTILAARGMMLQDDPMDSTDAQEAIVLASWLAETIDQQEVDGGPRACLQRLLASPAEMIEGGQHPTLDRLIDRARGPDEAGVRNLLIDHGLKLAPWPHRGGGPPCLLVANAHPRLERIFANTLWANGRWNEDLRRLPGAEVPPDPVSFRKGVKPRCVVIPAALLLEGEVDPP